MHGFSRALAVVAATMLMSSGTAPALAADQTANLTAVPAKTSPIKHRRAASIHHVRRIASVTPLQHNLGCSGEWCGRQFVLMIGIGF